jgi:hypothetical protein
MTTNRVVEYFDDVPPGFFLIFVGLSLDSLSLQESEETLGAWIFVAIFPIHAEPKQVVLRRIDNFALLPVELPQTIH